MVNLAEWEVSIPAVQRVIG